jgi:hypothetical protein
MELVVSPPVVSTPVGFSVIVMDDPMRPGAVQDPLAAVLAHTCQPSEILLVALADSSFGFALDGRLEVIRLQRGEYPNAAVNSIAVRATGSRLLVLDAGTLLAGEALSWFAVAIERTGGTVIYADQDVVTPDTLGRERLFPLFNPAFDRELLLQRNYIGETFCITRESYVELGGLTSERSLDPRHDLLLRALARYGRGVIMHIPLVLVHNRAGTADAGEVQARTLRTVRAHLDRSGAAARLCRTTDGIGRALPDAVRCLGRGSGQSHFADHSDPGSRRYGVHAAIQPAPPYGSLGSRRDRRRRQWRSGRTVALRVRGNREPLRSGEDRFSQNAF